MTSPIGGIGPAPRITPMAPATGAGAAGAAGGAGGGDFANKLSEGLENLQGMHDKSAGLAVKAATGTLRDAHDYLIASTEAGLATQLTVAVRNKAVEAFQEIMRMQA